MSKKKISPIKVQRFKNMQWDFFEDIITEEKPFNISWETDSGAKKSTVLWAWPFDIEPLALGHVLLDKILLDKEPTDLIQKLECHRWQGSVQKSKGSFEVKISPADAVSANAVSADAVCPATPDKLEPMLMLDAMHTFIFSDGLWDSTGCFHKAGIYDPVRKKLLAKAEDIGRHNCIDRLAGWGILNNTALTDKVLLISARMTSSLCAKALRAGFRILMSRSAVSTGAIAMAEKNKATLIGFARTDEKRFTVFSDSLHRLAPAAE